MLPLILASSSPYRRQLLARLGLKFDCQSPNIDETPLPGEKPQQLVKRLAEQKAAAVATDHPEALIIASDQVAALDGNILSKPGTDENALKQLSACRGRSVTFYTSLCLLNSQTGHQQLIVEPFTVHFRQLDEEQLKRYIAAEQPLDCAGSFKMEGLGISLFERLEGDDPNSLIGLPLIRLVSILQREQLEIP
jgi:MAF protein